MEGPSTTATAQFGGQGGAKRVLRQGHCEFDGLLFHLTTIFVTDRTIWPRREMHFWHKHRKVKCCYLTDTVTQWQLDERKATRGKEEEWLTPENGHNGLQQMVVWG